MASLGSAYVDVKPDLSSLMSQVGAFFGGSKWASVGTKAAAGIGAIATAGIFAGKALYEIGSQFDEAYDTIRVRTGATGKELEKLEGSFKDVVSSVPTDFDSAAKAVAGLNQRLDITGRPLQALSKQVLELSRITGTDLETNINSITRVFGDWGVKTREQGPALDELFRASQETGVEVSRLSDVMVKFGSPLRQLGFDFEETAGLVGKFEAEGVNTELVLGSMRIALGRLATEGVKDPAKALQSLTADIKNAGTAGKANALALETFGARAGPDMAAAIREGRFELGDLFDTIKNGNETIRGAGKDTMDFSEQWQLFKNRAMVALEPIAIRVFQILGDGMKWLNQNGPAIMKAVSSAFEDVKGAIRSVIEVIDGPLKVAFEVIKVVVTNAFKVVKEVVQGGLQAIRGIVKVFDGLLHLDFKKVWDGIKDIFSGALKAILGVLRGALDNIKAAAGAAFDRVKAIISGAWEAIKNVVSGAVDRVKSILDSAWDAVKNGVSAAWDRVKSLVSGAVDAIIGAIRDLPGKMFELGKEIINRLWDGLKSVFDSVVGSVKGFVSNIIGAFSGVVKYLNSNFAQGIAQASNSVSQLLSKINELNAKPVAPNAGGGGKDALDKTSMSAVITGGDFVPDEGAAPMIGLDADIYIGGEKINERVDIRIRERDRAAGLGYRAGVAV